MVGVAIVGAGPYGLSVAAHLAAHGIKIRVFGRPMDTWRRFMPRGMVLKSEGFAMDLSDPAGRFTLEAFCAEQGIPYQGVGWPVPVETFAAYGEAFQTRLVPQVEPMDVVAVEPVGDGFAIELETGERFTARNVVMATGIRPFSRMPVELAALPAAIATHSAEHGDMTGFAGKRVAVLGGGASAMDVAASLHRAGAEAVVVTRRAQVRFYSPGSFRSIKDRLFAPMTTLGPGWKKFLCVRFPGVFRVLPPNLRSRILNRYLGPSPAWSVRDIIEAHVDLRLETTVRTAVRDDDGRVQLRLADAAGRTSDLGVDHVIAATGYAIDLRRLSMLAPALRDALRHHEQTPDLSSNFESSIKGLFFVGTQSAASFGPMLRFVCGAPFAARQVARHVADREAAQRTGSGRIGRTGASYAGWPARSSARS